MCAQDHGRHRRIFRRVLRRLTPHAVRISSKPVVVMRTLLYLFLTVVHWDLSIPSRASGARLLSSIRRMKVAGEAPEEFIRANTAGRKAGKDPNALLRVRGQVRHSRPLLDVKKNLTFLKGKRKGD